MFDITPAVVSAANEGNKRCLNRKTTEVQFCGICNPIIINGNSTCPKSKKIPVDRINKRPIELSPNEAILIPICTLCD